MSKKKNSICGFFSRIKSNFKKCSYCRRYGHRSDECESIWCHKCHKWTYHDSSCCPTVVGLWFCTRCLIYNDVSLEICKRCERKRKIQY